MPTYTPEEIEERFAQLPESLKEQMMSVENSERIFEVGKKFGMTIEQIGFLAEESGYVVLGLTHPKDFVIKLKDHLRIDEEKAKTIAKEINHHVFFPLREILKSTHQFELTQEQIQEPPPPIPSTPRTQSLIPKSPPAIQNEVRHIEWPTPKNETHSVGRPTPPTTPPAPPVLSVNKPTAPAPPLVLDIKPSIIPTPIKQSVPLPSAPHSTVIPPSQNLLTQKSSTVLISPTLTPIPETTPQIPKGHLDNFVVSSPKSTTPIPLPPSRPLASNETRPIAGLDAIFTPDKPPESVNQSSVNHPLPPTERQTSPPLKPLNLSTIEEKKSEPLIPPTLNGAALSVERPAIQNETHPIGQSTAPTVLKSVEGIKPKEPGIAPTPIQTPLTPSQMMQKNLLEEINRPKTAIQSEVERMKESLFAPPSTPLKPPPVPQSIPKPPTQIPIPPTQPPQKSPAPYLNHDPYREPLE